MRHGGGSRRFATDGNVFLVAAESFYVVVNPLQRSDLILQAEIDCLRKAVTHQTEVNEPECAHAICGTHNNNVLLTSEVCRILQSKVAGASCVCATVVVNIDR